jgi:hypothetical protein
MGNMKRYRLQAIANICLWIGGTVTVASFVSKMMFHLFFQGTPYFFGIFLIGIVIFIGVRLIG